MSNPSKLFDNAEMTVVGVPGTGPITLNAAVAGYKTFADAGAIDGNVLSYGITDGFACEMGHGVYSSTGPTLTRTTIVSSSNSGLPISVSSGAAVYLTALADDIKYPPPAYDQSFDQASSYLILQSDFLFGSGAVAAGSKQIAITDVADLAQYFNPYQDVDGLIRVNSELEYYQPFNSSSNFVFNSGNLALTATLDAGQHVTPLAVGLKISPVYCDGSTPNPIANLGLTTTAGLQVGGLVALTFKGLYSISAIVADTSITLSAASGNTTTSDTQPYSAVFLPYYLAAASASSTGNVASFTNLPAGVVDGMQIVGSTFNQSSRGGIVTNVTGNVVTFDVPVSISSSLHYIFIPSVRSAQIWTKNYYGAGFGADEVFAFEITCQIPNNGAGAAFTKWQSQTPTGFAALPTTVPAGAWPAAWFYPGNAPYNGYRESSEIDLFEMNNSNNDDCRHYWRFTHGSGVGTAYLNNTKLAGGATYSGSIWSFTADLSLAPHKFQLIWRSNKLYTFLDGVLMKAEIFNWGSMCAPQLGVNLATGSLSSSFASALLFPYNDANFTANYALIISEMKFWSKTPLNSFAAVVSSIVCPSSAPNTLVVTFNAALNTTSLPSVSSFIYSNAARQDGITGRSISGSVLTLTKSGVTQPGDVMTLSYYSNAVQVEDTNNTPVNCFFDDSVTNSTVTTPNLIRFSYVALDFNNNPSLTETTDGFGFDYAPSANGIGLASCWGVAHTPLPASQDGYVGANFGTVQAGLHGLLLGFTGGYGGNGWTNCLYGIIRDVNAHPYYLYCNGASDSAAPDHQITCLSGDICQVRRSGTTVIAEVSQDGGSTFNPVKTWTGASAAALYPAMSGYELANILLKPYASSNVV